MNLKKYPHDVGKLSVFRVTSSIRFSLLRLISPHAVLSSFAVAVLFSLSTDINTISATDSLFCADSQKLENPAQEHAKT